MRLVALKPNTYGTRRLQAGDRFDMPDNYARTLIAVGLANPVKFDVVAQLQADAEVLGIKVDMRWGEKRLRAEIEAKQKWGS